MSLLQFNIHTNIKKKFQICFGGFFLLVPLSVPPNFLFLPPPIRDNNNFFFCNNRNPNDSNYTSVEAIVDKLSEVTNLAEQLDATINVAQSEGLNTSSMVTPNTKQLLDGTSSTSPEVGFIFFKNFSFKI